MACLLVNVGGCVVLEDSHGQQQVRQLLRMELLGIVRSDDSHLFLAKGLEVEEALVDQDRNLVPGLEADGPHQVGEHIHQGEVVLLLGSAQDRMRACHIHVDFLQTSLDLAHTGLVR
jgi:hypothetical protein